MGKLFPVPNYDINKYPECRKYVDMGFHNAQFNFSLDPTRMGEIFQGESPSRNKGTLAVTDPPKVFLYQNFLKCQMSIVLIKRYGSLRSLWPTIDS